MDSESAERRARYGKAAQQLRERLTTLDRKAPPREPVTYGQVAYEAYCATSEGRSLVSGATLPPWQELTADIRQAWVAAGTAAADLAWKDATGPSA